LRGCLYGTIIVVTDRVIELERSDREGIETHSKYDSVFLPKNSVAQITAKEVHVRLVIIHPDRNEENS
jgi:hypothetical protein